MYTSKVIRKSLLIATALSIVVLSGCDSKEEKSRKFAESGYEYLNEGDLQTARIQFNNAFGNNIENIDALIGLARVNEAEKEYVLLARNYQRILTIDPEHYEANLGLAKILLLSGNKEEAQDKIDVILKTKPEDTDALAVGAAILVMDGKSDEARALAKEILERDPTNAEVYNILAAEQIAIRKFEEALDIVDEGIKVSKDPTSLFPVRILLVERLQGPQEVVATFESMLAYDSDNRVYKRQFADYLLIRLRRFDSAKQQYLELLETSDETEEKTALMIKVIEVTYQGEGEDAAIEALEDFIAKYPKDYELRFALADMHCRFGSSDKCKVELESVAKETKDEDIRNRAENGLALLAIQSDDRTTAEKFIKKILKRDEANPSALSTKARLSVLDEDYETAIILLRQSLENDAENAQTMLLLAAAYEKTDKIKFASAQYAKAAATSPNDSNIATAYRKFLTRTDDLDRSIQVTKEYLSNNPGDIEANVFMVQSWVREKNWIEARRALEKLTAIAADNEQVNFLETAILLGEGNDGEAIPRLEELTSENDDQLLATELVNAYVRQQMYGKAEAFLVKRLEAVPDGILLIQQLSSIYLRQDKAGVAETLVTETLDRLPEEEALYRTLYNIQVVNDRRSDGVSTLRKGQGLAKNPEAIQVLLSSELISSQEYDEAKQILENLLIDNVDNEVLVNNLASLLLETSDDTADWQRALEMTERFRTSENPFYMDTLAWAYFKNGEIDKAEGFSSRAILIFAENADMQYHYGIISYEFGEKKRGIAALKKARELAGPNNHFIYRDVIDDYLSRP